MGMLFETVAAGGEHSAAIGSGGRSVADTKVPGSIPIISLAVHRRRNQKPQWMFALL